MQALDRHSWLLKLLVIICGALFVCTAALAQAEDKALPSLQNGGERLGDIGDEAGFEDTTPEGQNSNQLVLIAGRIVLAANALGVVVASIFIILAGWLWMTAEGQEERITRAKAVLRGSFVALVLLAGAAMLTNWLIGVLASGPAATF